MCIRDRLNRYDIDEDDGYRYEDILDEPEDHTDHDHDDHDHDSPEG